MIKTPWLFREPHLGEALLMVGSTQAEVLKEGTDVTLVGWGNQVRDTMMPRSGMVDT